ncbi:hypothetical protein [Pseudoroseomonas cervicalis]|uniref:hypothetical protein n=1 Tax=Teichococcus cervicalis TaxID=204525 RepID=UPI0022F1AE77|nr:hypothetical protein [Pseudoroseomonas cervicalis]WBV42935.1 hypothetical protein PFY06_17145 [Pseudoroseomonas cervicalis]
MPQPEDRSADSLAGGACLLPATAPAEIDLAVLAGLGGSLAGLLLLAALGFGG